jgi:protein tyrosine phosphatase (PTP) superfamily phosphohydrolase (DUF442 family)
MLVNRQSVGVCAAILVFTTSGCAPKKQIADSAPVSAAPQAQKAPDAAVLRAAAASRIGTIQLPTMTDIKPRDYAGLHNVVAYHDGFYSGSAPDGPEAYDTIAALGTRTIITVDGAPPDVAAAEARGMKYIHLPIGYNGFDESRKRELVRATRDAMAEGPVYIHCHHGKHRSAGAAAAIAASLGWSAPEAAVERMKVSGTAPNYKGLFQCAAASTVMGAQEIDSVPANFPSVSKPGTFVAAMVEIDEAFDHLKLIQKSGWAAPADHPDLVPVSEAGRLADAFRISAQSDTSKRKPVEFATWLQTDSDRAQAIEDILAAVKDGDKPDAAALDANLKLLTASCKDCHAKYRD